MLLLREPAADLNDLRLLLLLIHPATSCHYWLLASYELFLLSWDELLPSHIRRNTASSVRPLGGKASRTRSVGSRDRTRDHSTTQLTPSWGNPATVCWFTVCE